MSCKTIKYVYIAPEIQSPTIQDQPEKEYIDGGFKADSAGQLTISERDARILAGYIVDLKAWGKSGWEWVGYYISEMDKLKKESE